MVNPHWDETINEDIGFKGPHYNPPLEVTVPMWSEELEWGDVGGGGEFTGWRSAEDPPSYRSDWQDYPADEFTGIQSHIPSGHTGVLEKLFRLVGPQMEGAYGGRRTPGQLRQDAINWGQKAGLPNRISFAGEGGRDILNPNEMRVNAPSYEDWKSMAQRKMMMDRMYQGEDNPYYPSLDQDWTGGEDLLAKIYTSDMPGMQDPGFFWDSITPEAEAINTILKMPGMKEMRQGSVDDWNYEDFREKVPQYLWDQLPEGAFETLFDFRNQQPITVI